MFDKLRSKKFLKWFSVFAILIMGMSLIIWLNLPRTPPPDNTPSWRGITPGYTTAREVREILGQPTEKSICKIQLTRGYFGGIRQYLEVCFAYSFVYMYDIVAARGYLRKTHEIRFKGNTVAVIVEDRSSLSDTEIVPLEHFLDKYGLPEQVTWSNYSSLNALLYCEQGIIVMAQKIRDVSKVVLVYYFEPMETEDCLAYFTLDIPDEDPYKNTDIIVPEDPWGFNDRKSESE